LIIREGLAVETEATVSYKGFRKVIQNEFDHEMAGLGQADS
jgi:hypothetical protein